MVRSASTMSTSTPSTRNAAAVSRICRVSPPSELNDVAREMNATLMGRWFSRSTADDRRSDTHDPCCCQGCRIVGEFATCAKSGFRRRHHPLGDFPTVFAPEPPSAGRPDVRVRRLGLPRRIVAVAIPERLGRTAGIYNQALSRHRLDVAGGLAGVGNTIAPETLYRAFCEGKGAALWEKNHRTTAPASATRPALSRRVVHLALARPGRNPRQRRPRRPPGALLPPPRHVEPIDLRRGSDDPPGSGSRARRARVHHLTYADLVDRTADVCRDLCRFLEITFDPRMLELAEADFSAVYREPEHEHLRRRCGSNASAAPKSWRRRRSRNCFASRRAGNGSARGGDRGAKTGREPSPPPANASITKSPGRSSPPSTTASARSSSSCRSLRLRAYRRRIRPLLRLS